MSDSLFRKELAARLAETLDDSTTLPLLQLLCNSRSQAGWQKGAQALNPFASFADDVLGLISYQATDRPTVGIWEQESGTEDFVRSSVISIYGGFALMSKGFQKRAPARESRS